MTQLFQPIEGATKNLAVTNSSGSVALSAVGEKASKIRVFNAGLVTAFVAFGSGATTASVTTSMPLAAGSIELFDKSTDVETMAAITTSGTTTLYFTPGEGE